MKITIVTLSFNQARFLPECIDSVLSQDHDDIEYILVDPGSTDGSRQIISSYAGRVTALFRSDSGPAEGLNNGFAVATGDVCGFLNSDDKLLPGSLRRIARTFASRPDLDVISGCGYFIDANGRNLGRVVPSRFTPWLYAHGAVTLFQQGTFFRRACFDRTHGFNPKNSIAWDGELFLDMALTGAHFGRIFDDLALFRLHERSITGSGGQRKSNEAYVAHCENVFRKVTGRDRGRLDGGMDLLARLAKIACDPAYLTLRVGFPSGWVRRANETRDVAEQGS